MNQRSFSRRAGYLSYSRTEAHLPPNMNPRVGAAAKTPSGATLHVVALDERNRRRCRMSEVEQKAVIPAYGRERLEIAKS